MQFTSRKYAHVLLWSILEVITLYFSFDATGTCDSLLHREKKKKKIKMIKKIKIW